MPKIYRDEKTGARYYNHLQPDGSKTRVYSIPKHTLGGDVPPAVLNQGRAPLELQNTPSAAREFMNLSNPFAGIGDFAANTYTEGAKPALEAAGTIGSMVARTPLRPLETAGEAGQLIKGMVGGQLDMTNRLSSKAGEQFDSAINSAQQRNFGDAAIQGGQGYIRALGSIIPGVGEAAAEGAISAMTPGERGEGLGKLFGGVGLGALFDRVLQIQKPLKEIPLETSAGGFKELIGQTEFGKIPFQKHRTKMMDAEKARVGAELAKDTDAVNAANVAETQRAGQAFEAAKAQYQKTAGDHLKIRDNILNRVSPGAASTGNWTDVGKAVDGGITDFKAEAQKIFTEMDLELVTSPLTPGGAPLGIIKTKNFRERSMTLLKEISQDVVKPPETLVKEIADYAASPNSLTWRQATNSMTDLLEWGRKYEDVLPVKTKAIVNSLSEAMRADIESGLRSLMARKDIQPGALARRRDAVTRWAKLHRPAVHDMLRAVRESPEKAVREIELPSTTAADLIALKEVLPPQTFKELAAVSLQHQLQKLVRPETIELQGAPTKTAFESLQGEGVMMKFAAEGDLARSGKASLLWGDRITRQLYDLGKDVVETKVPSAADFKPRLLDMPDKGAAKYQVPTPYDPFDVRNRTALGVLVQRITHPTAQGIASGVAGLGAGLATRNPTTGLMSGAALAGGIVTADLILYKIAQVLVEPAGANAYIKFVNAIGKNDGGKIGVYGSQLAAMAEEKMKNKPDSGSSTAPVAGTAGEGTRSSGGNSGASRPSTVRGQGSQ